jgi:hypothetical protein
MTLRLLAIRLQRLFDNDQFVLSCPHSDLLRMFQAGAPLGFRGRIGKVIVMVNKIWLCHIRKELTARQWMSLQAGIDTGLIERQRIQGGKHPYIGKDGCVVFTMAVTVGGNIHNQGNVETRAAINDSLGLFSHAPVQEFVGREIGEGNGIEITCAQAATATNATFLAHPHLLGFGIKDQSIVRTLLQAHETVTTLGLVNLGLALQCCSILPARDPQPVPIFLITPPKPVISRDQGLCFFISRGGSKDALIVLHCQNHR